MTTTADILQIAQPCERLRPIVRHFWLSHCNQSHHYGIKPDGCVDLVLAMGPWASDTLVFGTTRAYQSLPLQPDTTYLGIRFQPGQSHHFIEAPASELTDRSVSANQVVREKLVPEELLSPQTAGRTFALCNQVLLNLLTKRNVCGTGSRAEPLSRMVRQIYQQAGRVDRSSLIDAYGRSVRQFERDFLRQIGVPFKLMCNIARFSFAAELVQQQSDYSQIALTAGFADQSHMCRHFQRFGGTSPSRYKAEPVVFVQYDAN